MDTKEISAPIRPLRAGDINAREIDAGYIDYIDYIVTIETL